MATLEEKVKQLEHYLAEREIPSDPMQIDDIRVMFEGIYQSIDDIDTSIEAGIIDEYDTLSKLKEKK